MKNFLDQAYLQGEWIDFKDAKLSVATHALHYGTAAFGGLRGIINKQGECNLFRLDEHCKRLANSAKFLGWPEMTAGQIREILVEFIQLNKPDTNIYIRPLVYTSDLDLSPRLHNIEHDLLVYGLELGDYLSADGVSVCFSSWMRQEDQSFPLRGKISGAYITSSLAKTEANARGFDESILMNSRGKVSEASAMNIFLVRDGQIITNDVTADILEGITRKSLIEIIKNEGLDLVIRDIDKTELYIADEVFLVGTAAKVTTVNKIENYNLPKDHPIADKLLKTMTDIYSGNNSDYSDWITSVKY